MEQAVSEKRGGKEKNEQRFFLTEEELVQIIIRSGKRLGRGITHRRLNVLSEFESSAGRADVVFYILRKKWRKYVRYGRLPARWIYVLRILPFRKRFSLDRFASLSGVSRKTAAQALLRYQRMGYCKRANGRDLWVKVHQPVPVVKKIIAVEAKLNDWKRAISQAYRYQQYANQAWVVLDESKARGAIEAKEVFQRLNIGLKVLGKTGRAKTYVKPNVLPPKSLMHFWEANGLIAAALDGR